MQSVSDPPAPRRKAPPRIMTYAEVEDVLKLSHASVYRLVLAGELQPIEVGGRRRIMATSVERYLRRKARESGAS